MTDQIAAAADPAAAAPDPAIAAAAAAAGGSPAPDPAAAAPAAKWYDDKRFDATRQTLTAKGLTVDDPIEAVNRLAKIAQDADKRIGKPLDSIMDRPAKDQSIGDWRRANAEVFGLPDAPDKYEITKPADWPKEAAWDEDGEKQLRELAHKNGWSNAEVQQQVDLQAARQMQMLSGATADLQAANGRMMTELKSDWGQAYEAKVSGAQQAFAAVAADMGLAADQQVDLAQSLTQAMKGDALVVRMFDHIAQKMGNDMLVKGGGQAAAGFGVTPAEARAKAASMRASGGEYAKAVAAGDKAEAARLKPIMENLDRLSSQ